MKINTKRTLCLFLALLLLVALPGCRREAAVQMLPKDLPKHTYQMELTLDETQKILTGHLVVTYLNSTGKALTEIPFFAYPNAYLTEDTAPFDKSSMSQAYPKGFSPGSLTVDSLAVDGENATYTLGNDDKTLIAVKLPKVLGANEKAKVDFTFTVKLPNSYGRFGYGDKSFNLCNFYPIACAYDGSKFLTYPYIERGDPFVSDMADYDVNLKVPTGMVAAHTGTSTMKTQDGMDVYTIHASDVRDFAAVLSRQFVVKTERVNVKGTDTEVKAYTYDDASYGIEEALKHGADAVKAFSDMIGPYPYPTLDIVQTDFFIGGMEYPNIVLIDQSLYNKDSAEMLEYVVVHETGHQWFYGVVGNDQVLDPWMDEALTEYITIRYFGYHYDENKRKAMYQQFVEYTYTFCDLYGYIPKGQDRVGLPSTSFDNDYGYSAVVYSRGVMMLDGLAKKVGQQKILDALSAYYRQYAGKRATKEQLLNMLDEKTGYDCTTFLKDWL